MPYRLQAFQLRCYLRKLRIPQTVRNPLAPQIGKENRILFCYTTRREKHKHPKTINDRNPEESREVVSYP